jgi:putative oxidoreductase
MIGCFARTRKGSGEATMQHSSHPLLSSADAFATNRADVLLLLARVLLAWVFVGVAYGTAINFAGSLGYFTSLKLPVPLLFTSAALAIEVIVSAGLILGLGTRYCAILAMLFVAVATAIAHRYWEYPAGAQQIVQYNNFLKNISIMGGALVIFVTGGGRFSLDRALAR